MDRREFLIGAGAATVTPLVALPAVLVDPILPAVQGPFFVLPSDQTSEAQRLLLWKLECFKRAKCLVFMRGEDGNSEWKIIEPVDAS